MDLHISRVTGTKYWFCGERLPSQLSQVVKKSRKYNAIEDCIRTETVSILINKIERLRTIAINIADYEVLVVALLNWNVITVNLNLLQ